MANNTASIINDEFSLVVPEPGDTTQFTGERFIPSLGGEIEIEHYHRYFYAAFFCKGKTVLDIACGEGYGAFILSQRALAVTGVDIAANVIEEAKRRYGGGNRKFKVGECTAIPCDDASFDVVVTFETIEHITEQASFLKEIKRVLKPGGLLVISSPDREEYGDSRENSNPFHQKELSLDEFRKLLAANFSHLELLGQTNAFGSFITPEGKASVFHEFHQEKGLVTTNKMSKATYLVAVCSDNVLDTLPTTFYGVPNSSYMMSGLQGGIKERDDTIIKLRTEIQQEKNSVTRLQDAQLKLLEQHESEKKVLVTSLEKKFIETVESENARYLTVDRECIRRGMVANNAGAEAHHERGQRIGLQSKVNSFGRRLHNLSKMNELESALLEGEGWFLRYNVNFYAPRGKFAKMFRNDETDNHRQLLKLSGLFDADYYRGRYPEGSLAEYVAKGWQNGAQPHPLFDPEYFSLSANLPSPRRRDPVISFLLQEASAQHSPHPLFDISYYLAQIPHNKFAARFPLTHFLLVGGFCGIDPHPLFDCDFYLELYGDVRESGINPLLHYVQFGAAEDRRPHACFDPVYYKSRSSSDELIENPLFHLISSTEMLSPSKYFSCSYYLNRYTDVANARMHPFLHFIRYGEKEDRDPHQYFSTRHYRETYPDVGHSDDSAFGHFILHGEKEGRIPYAKFDAKFYQDWHQDELSAQELPFAHFFKFYGTVESASEREILTELHHLLLAQRMLSSNSPVVSIIIPIFGKLPYTLRCLRSLAKHKTEYPFEIIVVDDLSLDESFSSLAKLPKILVVQQSSNQGFIAACNRGANEARGQYVLFLNNDTEVLPDWLNELVKTFEREKNVGLVGSKLIYPTGELQEAGGIVWGDGSAWNYGRNGDRNHPDYNYLRAADYVSGASILLRKSVFDQLGGFDTEYSPAYAEDCDLAFKIRNLKLRVLYQPNSFLVHCEGISSGKSLQDSVKSYQTANLQKLAIRWDQAIKLHGLNFERPDLECDREMTAQALFFDATTPTIDQDGGSLIAYYWMRSLRSLGYAVTFVPQDNLAFSPYYSRVLQGEGIRCLHRPYVNSIEEVVRARPGEIKVVVIFRYMVGEAVIDLLRKYQPQAKLILHNVDLHYLRMKRQSLIESDPFKAKLAERVKVDEIKVHGAVDLVHTLSDFERTEIQELLPDSWVEVSQPIQDCWNSGKPFEERKDICFIGGFRHQPNTDAVLFFVQEVMPLLRERLPGVRFLVVGAEAPDTIKALSSRDVVIMGHVKDLRDIFAEIKLSVAPVRFGAGVKTKVSASMGYGVPVIATAVAVEGMGLTSGNEVLTGNTALELADAIVRIYTVKEDWESVAEKAFSHALKHYSLDSFSESLGRQLRQLIK